MEQRLWRALGDPTRRRILDLLRDRPITTGELAASFEHSRFAVMKHLRVLEAAGLVTSERRGRRRLNHLNAVPLREIAERWLGPYQQFWSTSLLRLRETVQGGGPAKDKEQTMSTFNSFDIRQEITLDCTAEKVWAALTTDIDKWWAFHLGEEGSTISVDARLGGLFEERWGDGEGIIWGQVYELRRGKKLRIKGTCGMSGAGSSDFVYELSPEGDKTKLTLSHHAVGYRDPETADNFEKGWQELFEVYLKSWLEEGRSAEQLKAEK